MPHKIFMQQRSEGRGTADIILNQKLEEQFGRNSSLGLAPPVNESMRKCLALPALKMAALSDSTPTPKMAAAVEPLAHFQHGSLDRSTRSKRSKPLALRTPPRAHF